MDALTRYCREHIASLTAMDLCRARQGAHEASIKLMDSMIDLHMVLTPALGSDPIAVGELDSRTDAFTIEQWGEKGHAFAPFAYICNVTGQPSASLPVQLVEGEHPSAVQLAGHHLQDHVVLQVSQQLEAHFQWSNYRPPVWAGA